MRRIDMQPIRILQHNPVAEGSEVFQQVIGLRRRQPLARLIASHDRHRHSPIARAA